MAKNFRTQQEWVNNGKKGKQRLLSGQCLGGLEPALLLDKAPRNGPVLLMAASAHSPPLPPYSANTEAMTTWLWI